MFMAHGKTLALLSGWLQWASCAHLVPDRAALPGRRCFLGPTEQVIRDDMMIKAYDTLRCECFRIEDNISSVSRTKGCPSDLEQAVSTVIWAADSVDVSFSTSLSMC